MSATIVQNTITFFKTEAAAQRIAKLNNIDDEDTRYTVEAWPRGFIIAVHDLDGHYLGTL